MVRRLGRKPGGDDAGEAQTAEAKRRKIEEDLYTVPEHLKVMT